MARLLWLLQLALFIGSCSGEPQVSSAPLQCWGNEARDYSAGELVEIARACREIKATYQAIDAYNAALHRDPKSQDARGELAAILESLERREDAASVLDGGSILNDHPKSP